MNEKLSFQDYLPATHPLSPRQAFKKLLPMGNAMVDYDPCGLWERETAALPEQLQHLRQKTRAFAEEELRPLVFQADLNPHDHQWKEKLLRQAALSGVLTGHLPKPIGSAEVELMDFPLHWAACITVEELCAVCGGLGLLLSANALGMMPLLISGDKKAIKRFLIPANKQNQEGKPYLFAFAITEPMAGSDVQDSKGAQAVKKLSTVAKRVPEGWLLNGRKVYISGGDIADAITVFAALEGEDMSSWTCFLVEKDMPGFRMLRNELKMGQRAAGAAELEFQSVLVPDDHIIGGLRNGWALSRATLNFSRMPVAAIALGIARGAVEAAIDFVCGYQMGGKPLIEYQEVQLSVAQMLIETSSMRSMLWQQASQKVPTQASASICKVACSDRAVRLCESAMELLSNHGVLHENRVEKCFRDARLTTIYEGTNQINRLAVIEDFQEMLLSKVHTEGQK